jgi:pectin methylesterase-like acyl-CoA thioesterase
MPDFKKVLTGSQMSLRRASALLFLQLLLVPTIQATPNVVTVAQTGVADFRSVQAAIDAAPATGSVISIHPGLYREVIVVNKPHIELRGLGDNPQAVILSYDNSAGTAGGTGKSGTVTINADDFHALNLTIENTFSRNRPLTQQGSQAVAARVNGDRAIFRKVRFLGYQDTLYANSKRQYFEDCYIEGNVDFIFGDALAWFERCEIHALAHRLIYLTAQSKNAPDQKSGYVFHDCRITVEPGAEKIYLGRPWRRYATVIFLTTQMPAQIIPAGWLEWEHDGEPSLPTVTYLEFGTSGSPTTARDPHSRQLTASEAAAFSRASFLAGDDGWKP